MQMPVRRLATQTTLDRAARYRAGTSWLAPTVVCPPGRRDKEPENHNPVTFVSIFLQAQDCSAEALRKPSSQQSTTQVHSFAQKIGFQRFVPQSLKARLTLFTLTIVIGGVLLLVTFVKSLLRDELLLYTGEQQRSALAVLASQVNHGLQERISTLTTVASRIQPQDLSSPMAGQAFLLERPFLANVFNGGMVLWRRDGQRLADLQHNGLSAVNQPLDTQELNLVLSQGQPMVGRVHRDPQLQVGVFAIAVPVRDARGQIVGALGGATRLDQTNFLSELLNHRYGKTGHFFLIEGRDRLIFASSDSTRLMERLPGPGQHAMIDKFVAGFDGSVLTVNPHGIEVLVSVKQIAVAPWYASVTLPPDEVFALISAIQPHGRLAYLGLLCFMILAISWLVRHQLTPITEAVRTMAGFAHQHQTPQALPVVRADEVGELVGGFNQLLGILTQQQQVLQNSELFKQAVLNSVTAEIAVLDAQGVIVAVNEAWQREFCSSPVPMADAAPSITVGSSFLAACQSTAGAPNSEGGLSAEEGIAAVLAGQLPRFYMEYTRHTAAQQRWRSMSVTPMAQGEQRGAVVSLEDITDRVLAQNQVRELAFYDPLTGLPNRRLVSERLAQDLSRAKRRKTRLALMFIDLDQFKPVNDAFGHDVGDWLLQAVAHRIQICLRASDTAGRLGGDEFVALLPDLLSSDAALGVAEKIRQALAQEFITEQGVALRISSSIGVAVFPEHGQTEKDLLHFGDEAMYRAKKAGRNAVVMCNPAPAASTTMPSTIQTPSMDQLR